MREFVQDFRTNAAAMAGGSVPAPLPSLLHRLAEYRGAAPYSPQTTYCKVAPAASGLWSDVPHTDNDTPWSVQGWFVPEKQGAHNVVWAL